MKITNLTLLGQNSMGGHGRGQANFSGSGGISPLLLLKNTFPEVFRIKFSFLHLISNGLNGFNSNSFTCSRRLLLCSKILCSIFSKGTKPFDFIKLNIIHKLTYKVKYISLINRSLIMFFRNLGIRFFKIIWFSCEQYGKNHCKKKEHNQNSSVL